MSYAGLKFLALIIFLTLWVIWRVSSRKSDRNRLENVPYIVSSHGSAAQWLWARLKSIKHTCTWTSEGYQKYSKANELFVVPTLDSDGTVVIPRRMIKSVYGLPEHVLDVHRVQDETMQVHWVFPDPYILNERLHFNVVRRQLTQSIPKLAARVAAEIEFGFKRSWGLGTEWRNVRVWPSSLEVVAGAANGAFCGPPLCRDIVFLRRMKDHAMAIFGGALVLNCIPKSLHFIFGHLLNWISLFLGNRVMERSRPVVEERLFQTARWKKDPECGWSPPDDALQWLIDECYESNDPAAQLDPTRVCQRLLFVNDVSMLTTAYTAQNFVLDLFSTDSSLGYVEKLRKECEDALRESDGHWDHSAIQKLELVDSSIRESMRMNPFGTLTLPREVIHPDGVKVEGSAAILPQHTRVALPSEAIHYDESVYHNAQTYDPFRFAQPRQGKAKSTVTLDDSFLAFGVPGRWACPGRFFALLELKIFVAHLLLNYDVEFMSERPKPVYLAWARYPLDATIRIRRRASNQ